MGENNGYISVADRVRELTESAFSKALAAAILANFPICSIIAIILGSKALNLQTEARNLAIQNGISAGGKNIAARILGMVGKFSGIVTTVLYAILTILYVIIIAIAIIGGAAIASQVPEYYF